MAGENFEYDSHIWQEDEMINNKKDLPSDIFYVQIRYRKILQRNNLNPQERMDQPFLEEPMGPLIVKSFWVSKTSMLRDYNNAGADELYHELTCLGVPRCFVMVTIEEVVSFVKAKITEPRNAGREVLPIVVAIAAVKRESMYETTIVHPGNPKIDMPSTKRRRAF